MGNSDRPGLSRAWFILPSVLLLAGVLLAGFGLSSFVRFVRSDFRAYQPDSSISVTNDGFTLYTQDDTIRVADLRCTATGPDKMVQLRPVSGRTTLSNGQGEFVAIASTPKDLPAGQYVISCVSASADVDLPLYLGPRVDLTAVGRVVVFGVIAPVFLGLCSIVLFTILAALRYRTRRITASTPEATTG